MNKTAARSPELNSLDESTLELDDQIRLVWMRVSDVLALQCEGNPKLHDPEKIALSLIRNGFQDPPKWDEHINDGKGGLLYGNGRIEALAMLEARHLGDPEGWPKPRGVAVEKGSGAWVVQVKVGVGCLSPLEAKQFLIDHNSLTLSGGDFDQVDLARLYGSDAYRKILLEIQQGVGEGEDLTITTTAEVLEEDFADWGGEDGGEEDDDEPSGLDDKGIDYQNKYAVLIECDSETHQEQVYEKIRELGYSCKPLTV